MSAATDRERGLMAGIAAGNLLGITVEGRSRSAVRNAFPNGLRDIPARPGYPDDDDLAQSIIIAEAAEVGPLNVDDLGRRFWEWGERNGLGMGGLTAGVLTLYGGDHPQRLLWGAKEDARQPAGMAIEDASREAWGGRQAGNGALMRCAPIAIRWRDDAAAVGCNSVISAVPYAAAMPDSARDAIATAARAEISDVKFDGRDIGFTLLTLQSALISLWRAPDFEHGLRAVVKAGGDTDTNGAAAGAILGARFGLDAIPQRWRDRIDELRDGRAPMEEYADRLAAARCA